jgi:hypothetical protein
MSLDFSVILSYYARNVKFFPALAGLVSARSLPGKIVGVGSAPHGPVCQDGTGGALGPSLKSRLTPALDFQSNFIDPGKEKPGATK